MKIIVPTPFNFLFSVIFFAGFIGNVSADIVLDSGTISRMESSGGGFLGGTSTFNLTGIDPDEVELLANFSIVDAGVEVRVNGTSLFPLFNDFSQFSPDVVFRDTGVTQGNGNIESPFSQNNNGLPRLTITSLSDQTDFSGAAFVNSTSTVDYTPNFAVQDFSSLLNAGDNTIEFFVLNSFEGANLQGDFLVSQIEATSVAVPEPSSSSMLLVASMAYLMSRRRS